MPNPFALAQDEYTREIDPLGQYKKQAVAFLHTMTGKPVDVLEAFVQANIQRGKHGIRDPRVKYLQRQENGDRVQQEGTLMEFLVDSLQKREIIAPTLTTYVNPNEKESVLTQYVEENIKLRNAAKHAEFVAKNAGDKILQDFKNKEQTGTKLNNNAVSGAHASPSTPLFNKTAHSSLTSNCRTTSGYGNANNEKMIAGNRHYWSPHIVIDNIVSLTSNTNYEQLEEVMGRYKLHYPSIQETLDVITYSTKEYWRNMRSWNYIVRLVERLNPLQRAAFVYTGDLYHIRKFNDEFTRMFISRLSRKITPSNPIDHPLDVLKQQPGDYVILAAQICCDEMKGRGNSHLEYAQAYKDAPAIIDRLAATTLNVNQVLQEHRDFIRTFFVSNNVPASVAYIRESIRHVALTSDTDSTIFTVQDWVRWHQGQVAVDQGTTAVGATIIFLASQAIVHVLARMSANFGVQQKRIFQTAMKNEYYFPVFVPTNVAKHYYASKAIQEGNVLAKIEMEIKGVHLKSSNAPKEITKRAEAMMNEIVTAVANGEQISMKKYLTEIADRQRAIRDSLHSGDVSYYRLSEIKTAQAYKDPAKSQFVFYDLWEKAFSHKYPVTLSLPYTTIKIATSLQTAGATRAWVESITDPQIAQGFKAWLAATGKVNMPTIQIPLDAVKAYGIPSELLEFVDSRRIISDITQVFVLIMNTLGIYLPKGVMFYDIY